MTEKTINPKPMTPEIGKIYRLNDSILRCRKIHESGICVFDELNNDGTLKIHTKYTMTGSSATKFIRYRINELVEVTETVQLKLEL